MPDPATKRFLTWAVLLVLAITTAVGGLFAWNVYRYVNVTVPTAYAMWWAGDLVIQHLKTHDGAWPRGWDDLRVAHDQLSSGGIERWPFDETRELVAVDFAADPQALAVAKGSDDEPPFRVIRLRDGEHVAWVGAEPNAMIHAYLQSRDGHERP